MRHFLSCAVLVALVSTTTFAGEKANTYSRSNPIVEAVKKTKTAVVAIRVPRPNGAKDMIGTGVIVDERGFIVTNRHVVGASKNVNVRLSDGTDLVAEVLVAEPRFDLAILRVRANKDLPALELAPIDDLMEGEGIIAVGHPFGYSYTVTSGNISALGREITMPTGDTLVGLIQHSASINPGNSGGPLLNINGELIGINVALREGAQGIAFAINASTVKTLLSKHLSAQKVAGVWHGLQCNEKVLSETGAERQRVIVAGFQGKGIENGDEILSVANRNVANAFDVERALWNSKPGERVELKVVRQGKELHVTLVLAAGQGAGQVVAASQASETRQPALPTGGVLAVVEQSR